MHLFTQYRQDQKQCEEQMISGSLVINQTIRQVAQPDLLFGDVGASGMEVYHAKEVFLTFLHEKPVLR